MAVRKIISFPKSVALLSLLLCFRGLRRQQHPIENAAATHQHSSSFSIDKVSGVCVLINHNPRVQEEKCGVSLSLFFSLAPPRCCFANTTN
jgi:hypothetical protein